MSESVRRTRSRGACGNCKKIKRKCDETRPFCDQCTRRGVTCQGYALKLQWGVGIASRGRFLGAAAPLTESVPLKLKGKSRDVKKKLGKSDPPKGPCVFQPPGQSFQHQGICGMLDGVDDESHNSNLELQDDADMDLGDIFSAQESQILFDKCSHLIPIVRTIS